MTSINFQTFFWRAFKIVVDTWKFTKLLLYIFWDDWPIFMISASNQHLQQQLEYTLLNPDCHVEVLREFRKRFCRKSPALFKSGQWHFHQDNAPVHNSILVTDYLTKMGIKTVCQPPDSSDLASCDFWLFLSSKAVVMRELRRGKRLWRRSLTRSHKRTSMGHFRSCWNGTTSALQPEEISSKGTRVSCVYYQKSAHIKKSL